MQMYLTDVKWRTRIVSATARGVTAAGRTMVGTASADGTEFLVGIVFSAVVLTYHRSNARNRLAHNFPEWFYCSSARPTWVK